MCLLCCYFQVVIVPLIFSLLICSTNCMNVSTRQQESQQEKGKLSIQILRTVKKFTDDNNNPEKNIREIEERIAPRKLTITRAGSNTLNDYVPGKLYATSYYPRNFVKKKRSRRGRRRHKRGAKINTDLAFISAYPTNRRVYKIVNKLGYCLRIHMDGTIDGTLDHHHDEKCK